jgi:outer membrane immunogenic protein
MAGAAAAADLYSSKDAPAPIVPAQSWTGFYIGANVGGGWRQLDSSLNLFDVININHTNADAGIAGGGQLGYNYQTGALLLGIEADVGVLGFSQTRDLISLSLGGASAGVGTKTESGLLADVTGRIGYAAGPALFYAKGGWAYLDASAGIHAAVTGIDLSAYNVSKSSFDGWTIGGGIEYALSPSWSLKGEYQYFDFGSFDLRPIAQAPEFSIHNDLVVNIVKVGLNYHLNGGYAPLK